MSTTYASTEERLAHELSDPVTKQELAQLLGISLGSVYDSLRRFDAARIAGDEEEMRRHIPCLRRGGVLQADGTYKGGRFIAPRDAVVRWYTSVGLDGEVLERLYGKGA